MSRPLRLAGGRPRRSPDGALASVALTVRFTPAEYDLVLAAARAAGLVASRYVLAAALARAGPPTTPSTREEPSP